MLKFQDNHILIITNFEDFILLIHVMMDDLYKQFATSAVINRQNYQQAKLSNSEIITIRICLVLVGIDSENAWYSFVQKNYHNLFPALYSRTRFTQTGQVPLEVTELLHKKIPLCFSNSL